MPTPRADHSRDSRTAPPALGPIETARKVLIVPGLYDSGPGHWQTRWLEARSDALKVEQQDWRHPTLGEWASELLDAIRRHPGSVLVGHSLGCALIAHVAGLDNRRRIGGALLVAPAEVNRRSPVARLLAGFGPMPLTRMPFPSIVVASRNDPFATFERSQIFARSWGSDFVDAGDAGHINIDAGYGDWPEGERLLEGLLRRAEPPAEARFA